MTEHPASPRIDPRFDPRFQRGYAPDAAAPASDLTSAPDAAEPAPDAAAPALEPDSAASAPDPTPRDLRLDPAAPVSGFGDPADTPQSSVTTGGVAAASPNPATHGAVAGAGMAGGGVVGAGVAGGALRDAAMSGAAQADAAAARPVGAPDAGRAHEYAEAGGNEPELAAEPAPNTSATRWFWIALGVCAAFIVLGAIVYWTQASDPAYFMGGQPGFTQTMQQFVMALTPALVQAGVVGIAVVLVAWAIRGGRDQEERR